MDKIRPKLKPLFQLLGEGRLEDARMYVESDSAEVANLKRAYEDRANENTYMMSILTNAQDSSAADVPEPAAEVTDMDARGKVLQFAAELARQSTDLTVQLDAVVKKVVDAGIDLKSSRPGTSIGNILFKASPLWERVSPGLFRLIG